MFAKTLVQYLSLCTVDDSSIEPEPEDRSVSRESIHQQYRGERRAMTEQSPQTATQIEGLDVQWLTLQRAVAVGMVVFVLIPMVVVLQQVIPPLAVAGVLFAGAFILTWLRPRAGALGVGGLSGLWLLWQSVNLQQVLLVLTRPSEAVFFLATLSTLVLPIAGLVGLVGLMTDLSDTFAIRTLQATGITLLGGIALALLAVL